MWCIFEFHMNARFTLCTLPHQSGPDYMNQASIYRCIRISWGFCSGYCKSMDIRVRLYTIIRMTCQNLTLSFTLIGKLLRLIPKRLCIQQLAAEWVNSLHWREPKVNTLGDIEFSIIFFLVWRLNVTEEHAFAIPPFCQSSLFSTMCILEWDGYVGNWLTWTF